MNWTVFIARRFLKQRKRRGEGIITMLPILGIAMGIITLVTVIGIMNGFQLGFIENILEISSYHAQIHVEEKTARDVVNELGEYEFTDTAVVIRDSFSLLSGNIGTLTGASIRGVEPDAVMSDKGFSGKLDIMYGEFINSEDTQICLGVHLARTLGVAPGDTVQITGTGRSGSTSSILPVTYSYEVSGIFETGYYEYDSTLAFISLQSFAQLFPGNTNYTVAVKFSNKNKAGHFAHWWNSKHWPTTDLQTWKEINKSFFSALAVEKLMMILVVSLIFIVVSINLYHSIRRSILERREDLSTLKAVGACNRDLQRIILFEGTIIGLSGAALGAPVSLLLAMNINTVLSFIENTMYVLTSAVSDLIPGVEITSGLLFFSTYPVRILPREYILSLAFGLIAPLAGSYIASRDVLRLYPVEVLHYE